MQMSKTRYSDRYFEHNFSSNELGSKTAKGGVVMLVSQFFRFALQLVSTVILARIIPPEGFGLFGMVLVVVNFANTLKDMGLAQATIQREVITEAEVSNLFWFNFIISCSFGLVIITISPAIAEFFGQSELILLCMIMSVPLILQAVGIQHRALIARSFDFRSLALIDISSQLLGVLCAIAAAILGLGYWALAIQIVVSSGGELVIVLLLTRWFPRWYDTTISIKSYLSYGLNLAGANFLNYAARSTDNIIIGRISTAHDLGVYTKAYQLLLMPMAQINGPATKVALPYLSRFQSDPKAFRKAYINCLFAISFMTIPIVGFMFIASHDIIITVLGMQWTGAVIVFQILMPAVFVSATNVATGWVYQSLGTTNRQLLWTLYSTPIMILCMLLATRWGMLGVAFGVSLSMFLLRPFGIIYCFKGTPLRVGDFYRTILPPSMMALLASTLLMIVNDVITYHGVSPIIMLMLKLFIYVLIFCLLESIIFRGRNFLKVMVFWRLLK